MRLKAIDLFAGAGGLSLGLRQAGFDVVAAAEIDELAVRTYSANHQGTVIYKGDVSCLTASRLLRELGIKRGELDLLAGCPPCQGFSSLRTNNGGRRIRDSRNDLVLQFLRFVRVLRPKAVMLENVPALMTNWRLKLVRRSLESLGYQIDCRIVNAADYGVPQRRRRMILVATRNGRSPAIVEPRWSRRTVSDAIRRLPKPGRSGDPLHDLGEARSAAVIDLIRNIPRDGGSLRDAPARFQLPCHRRTNGFFDVYGRMAWNDVAPTITSGCHNPSKGRFLHPTANRTITLREAAILQTFPSKYRFSLAGGKERAALLIGNALPPRLIRRLATNIARELKHQK